MSAPHSHCTLDASGLHTIRIRDSGGTATGGYDMTLTCLTPPCAAGAPHVTIAMTATPAGRLVRTIAYKITVGNDGGGSAPSVVVEDTLPKGLFIRHLSSTQGTCSHAQRAVTCSIGALAPSTSVTVNITAATFHSGQVTNTACVGPNNCATTITNLP